MRGLTENQGGFSFVLLDNPGNKGPHKATVSHLSRRVVTNPRRARVGDNAELSRTHYFGGHAETDVLWRLRDTVQAPLAASFQKRTPMRFTNCLRLARAAVSRGPQPDIR